ncbi:TPA: preprotein translocase subunit SecA [Patescibacteria group bacterium]|nr:MAG: Protein translocase subunit SecA [Parcubacteria group bacterium GW2011_GWA2_46_39]HCU48163.1 preprotein translocase subunit SecA [Patescibacteria group bacterium]
MSFLSKIFGDPNARVVADLQPLVEQINELEPEVEKLSPVELKAKSTGFKTQLQGGKSLDDILPEAFACVRGAAKRALGQRHFDEQLVGGIVLHQGQIAEMRTGEGKTLTATLAVYLNALAGQGAHVVTVNDYLSRRDAVWMGQVYYALGMTTSCINHERAFVYDPEASNEDETYNGLKEVPRRKAYEADITYGTNNEFGFDYLRDNMVWQKNQQVQRPLHYAIVDEVDSILIDEARTPLIISAPAEEATEKYVDIAKFVAGLKENEDYNLDEKMRAATLTEEGIGKAERWLGVENLYTGADTQVVHWLEAAVKAKALFKRDRDYVVRDGEVVIVDEFTGRLMFGRRYSDGLHQAIEAKEGVKIQRESMTMATVTFQNYFRMYQKLAGMTGTAATEAEEFHKIYNLEVVTVPTHKPTIRQDMSDLIYKTEAAKYSAVAKEIKERHIKGQPTLVGTISIAKNEILGELLTREGIPHEVLNAKNHAREAAIIAQAGKRGAVTIATNMAGRGVDIILGGNPADAAEAEFVKSVGGLHVIGTERHESRRIDNQLRGRSGRQGDPGSSQFFVGLEDDLMRIFGGERVKTMMERLGLPDDVPIENQLITKSLAQAQKKVEGNNFDIRKHLVEYDDVVNKQREVIYRRRQKILELAETNPTALKDEILHLINEEIKQVVGFHTAAGDETTWDLEEIYEVANTIFPVSKEIRKKLNELESLAGDASADELARTKIVDYLFKQAVLAYDAHEKGLIEQAKRLNNAEPEKIMSQVERTVLLRAIDNHWVQHLTAIDHLRAGIGLRGYGQREPLVEYKRESYKMYNDLLGLIRNSVVYSVYKTQLSGAPVQPAQRQLNELGPSKTSTAQSMMMGAATSTAAPMGKLKDSSGHKVGRNNPCPCGATLPDGRPKKYKHCHGKNV